MSTHRAALPQPEAQLQWLNKLQRLFNEGEFTATYEFALLEVRAQSTGPVRNLTAPTLSNRLVT